MKTDDPFAPPPMADPEFNPYAAPRSKIEVFESGTVAIQQLVSGQKLVITALLLYISVGVLLVFAAALVNPIGPEQPITKVILPVAGLIFALGYLVALGMGIVGFFRLVRGLEYGLITRVFLFLLLLPFGLFVLLWLNSRATKKLRAAGYHVGLLGAKKG